MKILISILYLQFLLFLFPVYVFSQNTETIYLSGTGAENTVDWQFYCSAGMNSGYWTTISVPSCWEQEGFGSYNYGHDPFKDRLNETGLYRYSFTVPEKWKEKEIRIVFEGVMTDAEVKINGHLAGPVHQGAFYQFAYDITKFIKQGKKNQLEVFVKKNSDNLSVSQAERKSDFWVFGGIFRPVYLEAKPKTNISRVAIDARADGNFCADVYITNQKNAKTIEVEIQTLAGQTEVTLDKKVNSEITRIEGHLNNPKCWSPEFPNLYQSVFSLLDKNGHIIHQYKKRVGFRTVEVRESDGLYVNGIRVKMKGVCRHTFHPKYGRTSSKSLSITAVNLMKDMNMNAVRMSHYPPDTHFLDVCDSLGLFVLDELTAWQKPSYDDVVGHKLLKEMISRDVNHPSVIFWDNGNEGGENNHLNDDFSELDIQKRKVLHPWQDYDLTNTLHYINYNYLSLNGFSKRKIFFPTEFLHGLYDGGLGAGLDDYWQKMWNDPLCAGGFLWVFADEAIKRTDKNDKYDTDGNHAPDGILGPCNEKEGSFYTIKEIWSPVFFEKRYITPKFNGIFRIENRYFYTNFNECKFKAEWVNFSKPGETKTEIAGKTENIHINMEPGHKGLLKISLPYRWEYYDALRITATDRYGRLINTWSWPVKTASVKTNELLSSFSKDTKPELKEKDNEWVINTGKITISIRKTDGTISEILKKGKNIPFTGGPFFVSRKKKIKEVKSSFRNKDILIKVFYENGDFFIWTFNDKGLVHLDVAYEPLNNCQFAGITFNFPEKNIAGMKWLGDGPYRVYKNRMKGVKYGLWEKAYNNTITGDSGYIYPEFKGYHSNIYWAEIQGKNVPGFKVFIQSNDIFLRMLTPNEPKNPGRTKMIYPTGNISFLHGINAIGTKFKQSEDIGIQSAPYFFNSSKIYEGKLNMKLIFDFN